MVIIGISIILLLIFACIEISGITSNTHSANRYLSDIKDKLDEIAGYIQDKQKGDSDKK